MKRWCNIYFNDILMCQQHMKRWCNNVDWSLESVLLNIIMLGCFKEIWDGDPLFEYLNRCGLFKSAISYLEIVISLEIKDQIGS